MAEWMKTLLLPLVPSCVTAVVAALVTVHLSLRRFREERRWETKFEAYTQIIEALHHSKRFLEALTAQEVEAARHSEDHMRDLRERSSKSYDQLAKAMDTARFILCRGAVEELEKLRTREKADWYKDGPLSVYETELEAHSRCLERIIPIGRKDLGSRR